MRQTKDEKREVDGRKTFSFKNKQLSPEVCGGRFEDVTEAILRNAIIDNIKPLTTDQVSVNLMQSEMKIIIKIDWSFWLIYKFRYYRLYCLFSIHYVFICLFT